MFYNTFLKSRNYYRLFSSIRLNHTNELLPESINELRNKIRERYQTLPSHTNNDIILNDYYRTNKHKLFEFNKLRAIQNRMGYIWEDTIEIFTHATRCRNFGLDFISNSRKFGLELKNGYRTDNSSSKKENFRKLSYFKDQNPNYMSVYGVINCRTKNNNGIEKKLSINNQEIYYITGNKFLDFIFGKHRKSIVKILKNEINNHLVKS